jgi:hypothetical protein
LFGVNISADGGLGIYNDIATQGYKSSQGVSVGDWHHLIVHVSGNSVTPEVTVHLDGVEVSDLKTTLELQGIEIGWIQLGDSAGGRLFDLIFSQIILSTAMPQASDLKWEQEAAIPAMALAPTMHGGSRALSP